MVFAILPQANAHLHHYLMELLVKKETYVLKGMSVLLVLVHQVHQWIAQVLMYVLTVDFVILWMDFAYSTMELRAMMEMTVLTLIPVLLGFVNLDQMFVNEV